MSQPSEDATMKTVGGETASRANVGSSILTAESHAEAARCTDQQACHPDARYDAIAHGAYSVTLKCRVCGIVIRRDWD